MTLLDVYLAQFLFLLVCLFIKTNILICEVEVQQRQHPYSPVKRATNGVQKDKQPFVSLPSGNSSENATDRIFRSNQDYYNNSFRRVLLPKGNDVLYEELFKIATICKNVHSCFTDLPEVTHVFANDVQANCSECCLPCDCSEECFATGTCCFDQMLDYDVTGRNSVMTKKSEICDFSGISGHSFTFNTVPVMIRQPEGLDDFYMFIKSCSNNLNQSAQIINSCLYPNFTYQDVIPVYSPISNLNYKNIYCAQCSGQVSMLINWIPFLTCSNFDMSLYTFRSDQSTAVNDINLDKGCYMLWKPPNNNYTTCVDPSLAISECTIDSLDLNDTNAYMCNKYYIPIQHNNSLYRNKWCLFCNIQNLENGWDPEVNMEIRFLSQLNLSNTQDTIKGIDFHNPSKSTKSVCSDGLTFVPSMDECVMLYCGTSMRRIDGVCTEIMPYVSGVTFDFMFDMVFNINENIEPAEEDVIMFAVEHILNFDEILVNGRNDRYDDNVCRVSFNITDGTAIYSLHISRMIHQLIEIKDHFQKFNDKLENVKNVYDRYGKMLLKCEMSNYPFVGLDVNYLEFAEFEHFETTCPIGIAMTRMQFCESIRIKNENYNYAEQDDLELRVNTTESTTIVVFHKSEYILVYDETGHDVAQICLDTYLSRVYVSELSTMSLIKFNIVVYTLAFIIALRVKIFIER